MPQPIKKTPINPWQYFSKEITSLIDYITSEVAPLFGMTEVTPEAFVYSALEYSDCMLYKALNSYLNSMDLTRLHDEIGSKLIKSDGIINGKIQFNNVLQGMFNRAVSLRSITESEFITSDHILLAILESGEPELLVQLFNSVGLNYEIMVDLSQKVHDVITNDVTKINDELTKQPKSGTIEIVNPFGGSTKMQIIGGNVQDVMNAMQAQMFGLPQNNKKGKNKGIDYCTNLNLESETNEYEDLIGRSKELETIFNVLCRRKGNNALLIGEHGVGKTQCVYGLAKKINEGTVPLQLRNKEIWKLNPAEIMAGTQLRGMFEDRIVNLSKQLKSHNNVILFIDDLDSLFGTKKGMNSDYDTGGVLSDILSDGTTQIIATTTYKEYKSLVDNNPEITTRFQLVTIDKPSVNECVDILAQNKKYYEKFHNVKYSDEIIYNTVNLCERYITDKMLPSSAFDIIDELGSYKKLNSYDNHEANRLTDEIKRLTDEKEKLIKKDNIEEADKIHEKIDEFRNKLGNLASNVNRRAALVVNMDDLYHVMSVHTNIPITKISASEKDELKAINDKLKSVVIGQDKVIDIISRAIKRNKIGITDNSRTRLSILSVGQTGVGKCICGDTLVILKNKKTNEIETLTVNDFIKKIAGSPEIKHE